MNTRFLNKRRRDEDPKAANNTNQKKMKINKIILTEKPMDVDNSDGTERITKTVVPQPMQGNDLTRKNKLFSSQTLREALMPTLENINKNDLKAFRLQAIQKKLTSGEYSEPWEYVEDVWSTFENIWLSYAKTSSVYRICTKLSQVFQQEIDTVMQSMGYCCGRIYKFDPQELCCSEKELCTIPVDGSYFTYQSRCEICICEKCFCDIAGDTVTLDGGSPSKTRVKKDQFIQMKNNDLTPEPFVGCQDCGRKQHQICVLYSEKIWPHGFVCDNCLTLKGARRTANTFRAKNLPTSKLDNYIEVRVNKYLNQNNVDAGHIHIRMLFHSDEIIRVMPGMRKLFVESGELHAEFPYRSKAIFAFQELDGVDVCFFGMYVQEYGSECANPNRRRVYVTFLDSAHFFKPRQFRTACYYEILLGYMDYAKQLGFTMVHIWACPVQSGENYIFFRTGQKRPKQARLQNWYRKILRKGTNEGIINDFKDISAQAKADKLTSPAELPYFDEDFWPYFLEETIKELTDRKVDETGRRSETKNTIKSRTSHNIRTSIQQNLASKLFAAMRNRKAAFFNVRLHSTQSAARLAPIVDPDPVIPSDLMNGHNAFFNFLRDRNHEFSSLRRARFSTLCILYELHNPGTYICNICERDVQTRYHCRVCDDYDLCEWCKQKIGHLHEMDKLGPEMCDGISPGSLQQASPSGVLVGGVSSSDISATRKQHVQRLLQSSEHLFLCRDHNCQIASCQRMKNAVRHMNMCKHTNKDCQICKKLSVFYLFHAKNCHNIDCPHPFCRDIKANQQQRMENEKMLTIARSLIQTSLNILPSIVPNREVCDDVLLNASIEISRVQILLQETLKMRNCHAATQIKNVAAADSTARPQRSANTQSSEFVETIEIL